jgi:hypothetical protein
MPNEEFDPGVGADLVFENAVMVGDLVVFRRRRDGKVGVKRLYGSELDSFRGRVFRVEPGSSKDTISIRLFREVDDSERPGTSV